VRSVSSVRPTFPDPLPKAEAEKYPFVITDAKGPVKVGDYDPSIVLTVRMLVDGDTVAEGEIRALWVGAHAGMAAFVEHFADPDAEELGPCVLAWADKPNKRGQPVRALVDADVPLKGKGK